MTREEAAKFLAIVKVAYPTSYKDMDKTMAEATVNMWHSTFPDVPYLIMEMAFDKYRKANKFAPTVADIYECLSCIYNKAFMDLLMARNMNDDELREKALYVMHATERYEHAPSASIAYDRITDQMMLEGRREASMALTEGVEI